MPSEPSTYNWMSVLARNGWESTEEMSSGWTWLEVRESRNLPLEKARPRGKASWSETNFNLLYLSNSTIGSGVEREKRLQLWALSSHLLPQSPYPTISPSDSLFFDFLLAVGDSASFVLLSFDEETRFELVEVGVSGRFGFWSWESEGFWIGFESCSSCSALRFEVDDSEFDIGSAILNEGGVGGAIERTLIGSDGCVGGGKNWTWRELENWDEQSLIAIHL